VAPSPSPTLTPGESARTVRSASPATCVSTSA
jgi:hypothetical protein